MTPSIVVRQDRPENALQTEAREQPVKRAQERARRLTRESADKPAPASSGRGCAGAETPFPIRQSVHREGHS